MGVKAPPELLGIHSNMPGILPAGVAQRFKPLDVRPRRPTSRPNSRLATRTSALCTRRGSATPFRWRWSCRPLWDLRLDHLDDPSATTAIASRPGRSLSFCTRAPRGVPLTSVIRCSRRCTCLRSAGRPRWLDSKPLGLAELRGHVVVVNFWTLTCTRRCLGSPAIAGLSVSEGRPGLDPQGVSGKTSSPPDRAAT